MNEHLSSIGKSIQTTQVIAIIVSLGLFFFIFYLVRKKKIKEEYSLLWLFSSIVFIVFSIWRNGLEYFAGLMGIAYPPAALFLILLLAIFLILIEFSINISKLSEKNKILAQELALLQKELEDLKTEKKADDAVGGDDLEDVLRHAAQGAARNEGLTRRCKEGFLVFTVTADETGGFRGDFHIQKTAVGILFFPVR